MTNRNRVMYAIIFVCERYIKDLMDQYQGDVVKVPRIYRIAEHMAINTAMLATT